MKLIERFRAHLAHKALQRLRRQLQERSLDPEGTGWIHSNATPDTLYLLGRPLILGPEASVRPYTLDYLERQYLALKDGLARCYPDFTPTKITMEVEALFAAGLACDTILMSRAVPRLGTYHPADDQTKIVKKLVGLDIPVVFAGDHVTLAISRSSYYRGFGFFVDDHPERRTEKGMWCRAQPERWPALSGEKTL